MNYSRRRLIWHGMLLFLLGLLTGFVEEKFSNPRMGLAAHLEGVMSGTFLVALGAVWTEVTLTAWLKAATYCAALYGAYANLAVTTLAAVGTAALSPDGGRLSGDLRFGVWLPTHCEFRAWGASMAPH